MRKRICFVTTISGTIRSFLLDFGKYLVENENYDVTFICNTDESLYDIETEHIHYLPVKMKRGVAFDGLSAIWNLYKIFRREKFDIVQYSTKNASVYTCIAATLAGIRCRIYCQWGMMYIAMRGLKRLFIKQLELLISGLATCVESESFSIYRTALKEKVYTPQKGSVIWNGSACGVNLDKYDLTKREQWRKEIREKYGIPEDSVVFGWCGRITRDKGHNELFAAFKELNKSDKKARLLMVGAYDNVETIDKDLFEWARNCPEVIFTGFTRETQKMYSAMDVFCSLSYREGFGLVVIEAAAMGLPGIVTDVPGQIDTHENYVTGITVQAKDVITVVNAMKYYIDNSEKRLEMGKEARKQVEIKYEQKELFRRLAEHRNQLIQVSDLRNSFIINGVSIHM
jgi:glycosyltransferase involved in cell wall biosynthesis